MKMKSLAIAASLVLALAFGMASSASAVVVNDFGVRDVATDGTDSFGYFQSHTSTETPFADDYLFGVNNGALVTIEFQVNNSQGRLIDVTTGSPGIFSAQLLADGAAIGSGVFATQNAINSKTFTLAFADLQVGVTYTLQILGTVLAQAGGTYTFSANLSQVPLPAAVWLLLSALAGLAGVTRIRGQRVGAA